MTIQIIVSVITAAAAILALIISVVQIHNSNKQALFERRLYAYLTVKWMNLICERNEKVCSEFIEKIDNFDITSVGLLFAYMTNTSFLEEIQTVINHTQDFEYYKRYMRKIEELRSLSEEITLIFSTNIGHDIADFVYYYSEALVAIYKYKADLDKIAGESGAEKFDGNNDVGLFNCKKQLIYFTKSTFELSKRITNGFTLQKLEAKIKL